MAQRCAVLRLAGSALRPFETRASVAGCCRMYATFDDREKGEERVHFRKEDERLLRQLLTKVKKQADELDAAQAKEGNAVEEEALKQIVGKYNVSDADLKALIAWKHS